MSAHGLKIFHADHERAPLIIAGAIILVIAIAAFGGRAVLSAPQNLVTNSSGVTLSVGRAFYPLDDGINCRDVAYNLANGSIVDSAIRPCADGALLEPRRRFIWGR